MSLDSPCPCGSQTPHAACCGPLHAGARQAETPEQLMRSRYSAYALDLADYVFRTWHPRTRPDDVTLADGAGWQRLEVLTADLDPGGDRGTVEFRAVHTDGVMHELSRFERRAGRWFYLDGDQLTD